MSTSPSDDYVHLSKMVESFGCFIEKICSISTTPNKNLKKLSQFKNAFYTNFNSQEKLISAIDDLSDIRPKLSVETSKNASAITKTSLSSNTIPKPETQIDSAARVPMKVRSNKSSQLQEVIPVKIELIHEWQPINIQSEYVPISNFLARIKAATHTEIVKLFSLSSNYLHARIINERQSPIFIALFLCYFENIVRAKSPLNMLYDSLELKVNNSQVLREIREEDLYIFLQELLQDSNYNESERIIKFYEHITRSKSAFYSGIKIFKKLFDQVFPPDSQQDSTETKNPYQWLNDIENLGTEVLQSLAQLLNISFRILMQGKTSVYDKIVTSDGVSDPPPISSSPRNLPEHTIFYDSVINNAYILYSPETMIKESPKNSSSEQIKQRAGFGSSNRPPLDADYEKSRKTQRPDLKVGSLPNLETGTSPITSFNELENKPPLSIENSGRLARRLSGLENLTSGFGRERETSLTPTHHTDLTGRPSFGRGPYQSCPKEAGRFNFQEVGFSEERLTPKEKEPVPSRWSRHNSHEGGILEDKAFGRQNEKNELYNSNSGNWSSVGEHNRIGNRRLSIEEKGRYFGLDWNSNITREQSLKQTKESLTTNEGSKNLSVKTSGIPGILRTRFDNINLNVNQRDADFDKLVGRYIKKGGPGDQQQPQQPKAINMTAIMSSYQNILNRNKENEKFKPSIGNYMRMDQ